MLDEEVRCTVFQFIPKEFTEVKARSSTPTLAKHVFLDLALCTEVQLEQISAFLFPLKENCTAAANKDLVHTCGLILYYAMV